MKYYFSYALCSVILFCSGCESQKLKNGHFPEQAVNLKEINSPYDDINSDIPFVSHQVPLVFSTNRANPQTRDFNLTVSFIDFNWDKSDGVLSVHTSNTLFKSEFESFRDMVRRTESSSNEKGPYSFVDNSSERMLLFSREVDGLYSIFVEPEQVDFSNRRIQSFRMIEGDVHEMYPSFYGKEFVKGAETTSNGRPEFMIFSSNQDGQFDIYEVEIPATQSILLFLLKSEAKAIRKLPFNTTANDHMPFVYGDLLVFASDRPGGYGGYDLYYSKKTAVG